MSFKLRPYLFLFYVVMLRNEVKPVTSFSWNREMNYSCIVRNLNTNCVQGGGIKTMNGMKREYFLLGD